MSENEQEYAPLSAAEAFGLDDEFKASESSEYAAEPQAEAEPELITREYDFGYGPMTFQGATEADITNQVIQAQNQHFQRILLESGQGQQKEYFPAAPREYDEIADPTNDELGQVMLSFSKDPIGAVGKLLEWRLKRPLDVILEDMDAGRIMRVQKHAYDSAQSFTNRHQQFDAEGNHIGGDYFPCPENADRICRLLEAEGRQETPENMEYAWSKLRSINGLVPYPNGYFDTEEVDSEYRASTAISGRDSYTGTSASELDDDDFIRAARSGQMSAEQIENEFRKRKYASMTR